jgi:hypothetical protein
VHGRFRLTAGRLHEAEYIECPFDEAALQQRAVQVARRAGRIVHQLHME